MKSSKEIRQAFIDYFKNKKHEHVESSPLIPQGDATLLFANAGMNQFKNLFIGLEERNYKRAVSSQKCVRAGGKHNDLENVGFTARHHTFFEMLGNFSFGDYFKKDAIHYAWDFLTNVLKIDKDRLYVTVHISDDEAAEIWQNQESIPAERIFRFDEDNFWRMGDTGPCGPCSEIFFDHAPTGKIPTSKEFEDQSDRFVEVWNLVFMQYNEDENGRTSLPNPSIDTGAGLERLSAVMQGQSNNYDTDLFEKIIASACSPLKLDYTKIRTSKNKEEQEQVVALRVAADHARSAAFLIADGVLPSNEGRGYVLRRIMRRALRYCRTLPETKENIFLKACEQVIVEMGGFYPELEKQKKLILTTVEDETNRFLQTLDQGTKILEDAFAKLKGEKTVPGDIVFTLYDTYGFPPDLTRLMANEKGFSVDEEDFEKRMEAAKEKARASWKGAATNSDEKHIIELAQKHTATNFTGYEKTNDKGKALQLSNGKETTAELSEHGLLISDTTPFYAESGGQVGDRGTLKGPNGKAKVLDCTKNNDVHFHHIEITEGSIKEGDNIEFYVESSERRNTASNHSATHLLHSALRKILGDHVSQAGSLVEPTRLRFDFTHNKALKPKELEDIENWVNREISMAHDTATVITDPKSAIEKEGALALFGEKYGDEVRVLKIGPNSTELCGGIHVKNTAMIRAFCIVTEAGVSAGIRRIEALTGDLAIQYMRKHVGENLRAKEIAGLREPWTKFLDSKTEVTNEIQNLQAEVKKLKKDLFAAKGSQINIDELVSSGKEFTSGSEKGRLVTAQLETNDRKMLSDVTDKLKNKVQSGVVITVGQGDGSHPIIIAVTKNLMPDINAGKILKDVASVMGGKGGGRPDFAQGAVTDITKTPDGFKKAENILGLN